MPDKNITAMDLRVNEKLRYMHDQLLSAQTAFDRRNVTSLIDHLISIRATATIIKQDLEDIEP